MVPDGVVPSGVLIAMGSVLGGWSFHFLNGHLRYVHNLYGKRRHELVSPEILPPGLHRVAFEFEKDESLGGKVRLVVDGNAVSDGVIDRFTPAGFNGVGAGLTCGYESPAR